jgi:hypothetical protein
MEVRSLRKLLCIILWLYFVKLVSIMKQDYLLWVNLARKYESITVSSVAVERMFSTSGHIHSLRRSRLGSVSFSD